MLSGTKPGTQPATKAAEEKEPDPKTTEAPELPLKCPCKENSIVATPTFQSKENLMVATPTIHFSGGSNITININTK